MDHYNATVHNGALVSTRRGLHVSKTKHHGTRFVNTFAAPTESASSPSPSPTSRARPGQPRDGFSHFQATGQHAQQPPQPPPPPQQQERKYKFVARPKEKTRGASKGRTRRTTVKESTPYSSSDSGEEAIFQNQAYLEPTGDSRPELLLSPQEFFSSFSPSSTYIPNQWKTHRFDHNLPETYQKLIHVYLHHTPRYLYPGEELLTYNPVRDPSFFDRINGDKITMQSVIMTAVLMESVQKGDISFNELHQSITKVCGMVNERLTDESRKNEPAVLESIAAMAIAGLFMGRHDLWHVHMKGLSYVIAQNGGLMVEWGHVLNKIRKADVKGAAYTGGMPYLEFTTFFNPFSDALPADMKTKFAVTVQRLMQSVDIAQVNIDSVRALIFVTQAITFARHAPAGSVLFDPQSYAEEFMFAEYQLTRYPNPLVAQTIQGKSHYTTQHSSRPETDGSRGFDSQSTSNDSDMLSLSPPIIIPAEAANFLDPIIRAASILYIEELLPEPRTVDPYGALLTVLNHHVLELVQRLRGREAAFYGGAGTASVTSGFDGLPQNTAAMRPILLWVCVVVYAVTQVIETDSSFCTSQRVDRAPYQDCVALLLGVTSPTDVDALPARDFELSAMLPIQEMGELGYDDRVILKQIAADYEARQMAAIAPYL